MERAETQDDLGNALFFETTGRALGSLRGTGGAEPTELIQSPQAWPHRAKRILHTRFLVAPSRRIGFIGGWWWSF
jgi:hypothetical protein